MNNTDSQNNDKVKFQSALLIKIVIAIILGIILGLLFQVLPFGEVLGKILMTLSKLFSNFLSFIVPLLVVGLVAPGIGHLGKDAGKLLLITIAIAYAFTLFSGFGTYFVTSLIYPFMLDNATIFQTDAHVENSIAPYFTLDMPPVLSVTSALIFAFVIGFGLAVTKTDKLMDVIDDLRIIINKIIVSVIIPLLPFYILTIFMNITYVGEIGKVLVVFIKIIILIFILTVVLLLIFFSIADSSSAFNILFNSRYCCQKEPYYAFKKNDASIFNSIGDIIFSSYNSRDIRSYIIKWCSPFYCKFCYTTLCYN